MDSGEVGRFPRLSWDPVRRYSVGWPSEAPCVVNFAPAGIIRWSSKREGGCSPRMSIFFRQASEHQSAILGPGGWGNQTSRRRRALSKKSRSCLMETLSGVVKHNLNDVRLTMFLQGNSMRADCRCSSRNEGRSPLKSAVASTGLRCGSDV